MCFNYVPMWENVYYVLYVHDSLIIGYVDLCLQMCIDVRVCVNMCACSVYSLCMILCVMHACV